MQVPSPRHWTREDPNPESPSGPTKFCTTWLYAARHSILTFSLVSSKKWKLLRLFVTARTIQSMESPGQNTGVGSLSLLQGIFPTQGSNPGLPHCRRILYQLSHQGSPPPSAHHFSLICLCVPQTCWMYSCFEVSAFAVLSAKNNSSLQET